MDDAARKTLIGVVGRFGRDICDDPRRCEALLRDLCPQHGREIRVLVAAAQERVPQSLLGSSTGGAPLAVRIPQLTRHLHHQAALAEDAARWAVESWAVALGLVTPAQLSETGGRSEAKPPVPPTSSAGSSGQALASPLPGSAASGVSTPTAAPTPPQPSPPPSSAKRSFAGRRLLFVAMVLGLLTAGYVWVEHREREAEWRATEYEEEAGRRAEAADREAQRQHEEAALQEEDWESANVERKIRDMIQHGVWDVTFYGRDGSPHNARLYMRGSTGSLRVAFDDPYGETILVDQTVTFQCADDDCFFEGANPTDPNTGLLMLEYLPDRIYVSADEFGDVQITEVCDSWEDHCSQARATFLGLSTD
jgi:hypothetical protein